jgi:predicted CXXCH cytochrome family protein
MPRVPWILALILMGCQRADPEVHPGPGSELSAFAGSGSCLSCHAREAELWAGSHHDLAMQPASAGSVLGDFDGATLEHFNSTSRFTNLDGEFFVTTLGPDGGSHAYKVAWVFGVQPLQQYLVEFPGGRLQTLPTCWDTRPASEGGQRWFHIYPDEPIPPGDELHWTGPNQTWNFMCASCHSTGLKKGYDHPSDTYQTTWFEDDVSCETCHGPARAHVDWAQAGASPTVSNALAIDLSDAAGGVWAMDPETGNAVRSVPRSSRAQGETCARCHSRRSVLHETPVDGTSFHDNYRLSLLDEGLYHADGQILDEVYVYGSFLQSRMHTQGVTCGDCHDPHSSRLLFEGNALCAQCHLPEKYDRPEHHHHSANSPGSQCVECHMPSRTYMVVDPRRDHSLRVPRPDLSVELGTPNACTHCHEDQPDTWAADAVRQWFPEGRSTQPHFARALHAARSGSPGAGSLLAEIAASADQPPIVRATALSHLPTYLDQTTFPALAAGLADPSPLVRAAAVEGLQVLPLQQRANLAFTLLEDPVRLVRISAARTLASFTTQQLPDLIATPLEAALAELRSAEMESAERASARVNLAQIATEQNRLDEAIAHLRTGLTLEPHFVPVYVNLADLLRRQDNETEAESTLRAGLKIAPGNPALHHALGLLLARTDRLHDALNSLSQAMGLAPGEARFAYAHALAMDSLGNRAGAIAALEQAQTSFPTDREILHALATMNRDEGHTQAALGWARKLQDISPEDEALAELVQELGG